MSRRLALLALLTMLSCRKPARVDPALARLIPADSVFLAGARVADLRDTPAYRKWIAPALDDLARGAGLEPPPELTEALVASDGAGMLVMARGKFSPQAGQRKGSPYKGYSVVGGEHGAVVFMDSATAVAGPPAALRALIDQRGRGGNPDLLRRAEALPGEAQVWAVSVGAPRETSGLPGNLRRIAPMLESLTAHADLRAGLRMAAEARCRTPEDARSLNDALAALRAFARLGARRDPALQQAYDAIHVELADRNLRITADLPQELVDRLAESR